MTEQERVGAEQRETGAARPSKPMRHLRAAELFALAGMFGASLGFPPPRPPRARTPEDDEREARAKAKRERKAAARKVRR